MTARLFTSALFAGLVAGLIAVLLQWSLMESLILEGEAYETGAKVHFAGVPGVTDHAHAADETVSHTHPENVVTPEEEAPEDLVKRFSLAFFADFTTFVAWSLLLVAGFATAEKYGQRISVKDGVIWGIAGFAAIHIMPGIGLAPELPGQPAADLQARQLWWAGTALASVAAFAMFAYGRNALWIAIGLALLVVPQLIGAPRLAEFTGVAPPELSGEYVARSYAVSFMTWVVLGLTAGYFWNRDQTS